MSAIVARGGSFVYYDSEVVTYDFARHAADAAPPPAARRSAIPAERRGSVIPAERRADGEGGTHS